MRSASDRSKRRVDTGIKLWSKQVRAIAAQGASHERRERGTGRLVKALIYFGDDLRDCHTQAEATRNAMGSDGYATVVGVRGYDNAAFKADPLKAVPNFKSAELM